jgi:RNA polymerase sigma-70 factor (ECF subfamily)
MERTPVSLLERLRRPSAGRLDHAAWAQFVRLYTPLLYYWAQRHMGPGEDPADLVQDIFTLLVRKLPEFVYDPGRNSFRSWLRTVAVNRWRDRRQQRTVPLEIGEVEEPEAPDQHAEFEEAEYRAHVVGRIVQLIQGEFPETVWRACWEYVIVGRRPAEVACELGISVNMVYLAKSRVLTRLRQELQGLLD